MFLSFPPPTKMFQFRGLAHLAMCQVFYLTGCPIQKSPDQILFANPRSFSQLTTSFFASKSLGIPHTPLFTWSDRRGSNPRSRPWQGRALPNELNPRKLEAPPGIGPGNKGFADLCLTAWLWCRCGAGNGARTRHLRLGKAALYQMSYSRRIGASEWT